MFICDTCKCSFTRQYSYTAHCTTLKHLERLANTSKHVCECGKQYLHQPSLSKHRKKCDVVQNKNKKVDFLEEQMNLQKRQYEQERKFLKKQISELMEKYENLSCNMIEKSRTTNNNTQIDTQNNTQIDTQIDTQNNTQIDTQNNNINININAFGHENLDYIDDAFIKRCINQVYKSIPSLIEHVHFDPKHPENHNVKITNKKLPHAAVLSKDKEWKLMSKQDVIDNMVDSGYSIIDDKFNEDPSQYTESRRRQYRRFQEKYDNEDKETIKQIKRDVEYVVLNGTRKIHST